MNTKRRKKLKVTNPLRLFVIIGILILIICLCTNIFKKQNKIVETSSISIDYKKIFEKAEKNTAKIDKYTVYGTYLNINGSITNIVDSISSGTLYLYTPSDTYEK